MNKVYTYSAKVLTLAELSEASGGCHRLCRELIEQAQFKVWTQMRQGRFDLNEN